MRDYYSERLDADTDLRLHGQRERYPDAWNDSCCRYEASYGAWAYGYSLVTGLRGPEFVSWEQWRIRALPRESDVVWGFTTARDALAAGRAEALQAART